MSQFIKQQSKTRVVAQERRRQRAPTALKPYQTEKASDLDKCNSGQRGLQECVWGGFFCLVYVCAILTSPLLNLACIARGSLLVSPRDSQSVLALQYKEILIFKKLPPSVGSVFLQGPCAVIAQLEYMFASICVCVYVCVLFLSMLPFLFHIKVGHVTEKGEDQSQALVTSLATRAVLLCYYNRSTRQSKWKPSETPFWDSATKLGQISSLALSRSKAGEGIFTAAGGQFDMFRPGLPRINVDLVHKFVSEALLSCFCH